MHWTTLTRRQGGLVARRQLRAIGLADPLIDSLLRARRLEPLGKTGLYRAAGAPHSPDTPSWLAVLSTNSPLSYLSAGLWWEMTGPDDGLVHITRFDRQRLRWPRGVRVHRVLLDPVAVTIRHGLMITTRTETLLDCLGWVTMGQARSLADRAVQQRWLSPRDITRRLEEQPGRWGNRQLRRLITTAADGADAESERRLHALLRSVGLSGWHAHLVFQSGGRRFEIDVAFPRHKIAIEVDGYRYHSGDDRYQRDRTKQNALMAAGWRVLRFTWADIDDRPGEVITQITSLLAA